MNNQGGKDIIVKRHLLMLILQASLDVFSLEISYV